MLDALLSLRHPGVRFEVVNAAMTGINSHTILPIARDCADAGGDIWVIYMGNNEVVGPFGAGTVFGPQTPPLPLIRASLALKATRTGEWLESIRERIQQPPASKSEWGGMEMFLGHQVWADDPRMKSVYGHFERNLDDIIATGRSRGAGIVLSTVAVNLKDCAPFASNFRPALLADDTAKWKQIFGCGCASQDAGHFEEAAAALREAAQIDDSVAELRFRQALCALRLGKIADAQEQFSAARDLDTLRFRCDSHLNGLIRRMATGRDGVMLADAEAAFAQASPDGLPGQDLFYEHVHLTFEGNYLLARTIAEQAEKLLPKSAAAHAATPEWPTLADCAARLGWSDRSRQAVMSDVLVRLADPPFTGQLNHDAQVQHWTALMQKLAPAAGPAGLKEALHITQHAADAAPDDALLQGQLATLKQAAGDSAGAQAAAVRMTTLLPSGTEGWLQLGAALVQQQRFEEAATAFRSAYALDPEDVWALQNLAQSLVKLGRRDEAIAEYRHALAVKPRFGLAWLGLGQVLEQMGRKAEADDCYQKALANRIHRAPEMATLARFCEAHGWHEAAATNYAEAILLSPADPALRFEAGQSLSALGNHTDAAKRFGEAAQLSPEWPQAQFLWGLELGRAGHPAEAADHFREAVRLMPDLIEARLNLGIALSHQGNSQEALVQFEAVLQRSPTNALALQFVRTLRQKSDSAPKQ